VANTPLKRGVKETDSTRLAAELREAVRQRTFTTVLPAVIPVSLIASTVT
jgi:hypothetical protein